MSRLPSDSTDALGVPAAEATSDAPVFLSRREARAAREAAEAQRGKTAAAAATVHATVTERSDGAVTAQASPVIAVPQIPVAPAAVVQSDVALARPVVIAANDAAARSRVFAAPKRPRRNPIRAVASMAVIGGLLAVAGLPAYGQSSFLTEDVSLTASADAAVSTASAQSVTVSADLALQEVEREHFEATSPEDLALIRQQTAIASANALYAASGAQALGDDYPWATAGYNLSPLNYYYRQCTDFVAWRLNRDVGSFSAPFRWAWSDLTPNGGNASQWKDAWDAHGWTVSATPVVGSVAWFGWDNHVAYVKSVEAGKNHQFLQIWL